MAITKFTEQMKKDAYFNARVYFTDGNKNTFFSLDHVRGGKDSTMGLERLKKMIQKWGDKVDFASIYKNTYPVKDGGDALMTFRNGAWV